MTRDASGWEFDRAEIPDESMLLRRVPRRPTVLGQDPLTGEYVLLPEAFTYDHGSGLSVSVGHIGSSRSMKSQDVLNWATHGAAVFPVLIARSDHSGIVPTPTVEDPTHGCVRVEGDAVKAERRAQWLPLRSKIRESATYCDSAPEADALWLSDAGATNSILAVAYSTVVAGMSRIRLIAVRAARGFWRSRD